MTRILILLSLTLSTACEFSTGSIGVLEDEDEPRVLGQCPDDVVDIPIDWEVLGITAYGTPLGEDGEPYAAVIEIEEWEADRFTVAYACPPDMREVNVWIAPPSDDTGDTGEDLP